MIRAQTTNDVVMITPGRRHESSEPIVAEPRAIVPTIVLEETQVTT